MTNLSDLGAHHKSCVYKSVFTHKHTFMLSSGTMEVLSLLQTNHTSAAFTLQRFSHEVPLRQN